MIYPIIITSKGTITIGLTLRQQLAAAMAQPIRTTLDYAGIAHRIFLGNGVPK